MLLRGLLLKLNVAESQLNGYPDGASSQPYCPRKSIHAFQLFALAGETTFDIGIKMQDDIDYDPTMVDRTKVRLHGHAATMRRC